MVKKGMGKGKGAASSSGPPLSKAATGPVKPKKVLKKKGKAGPEKQNATAAEAAVSADASAPLHEPMPAPQNDGADMKMEVKEERPKGEGKVRMNGKEKKDGKVREESSGAGFIFMCNAKTKPECFRNNVFGLPKGKIDVVEKMRPGTKLFLYDFDLKLLYGVYKTTTKGGLDLVPRAFGGRFPAQVKFKIDKDCLPIPESSFKHAIKENYNSKGKFTQDLNSRQVHRLLALYKPVKLHRSSSQHVEERPQAHRFEGHMPRYHEERRQPYGYEERRLPQHDEEIRHRRLVEEHHALTQLPEFHHAPPTYNHHVALASNELYYPHQTGIIYESSAPRASGNGIIRDPLLARDYRALPPELAAHSNHVNELYHSYKLHTRPEGLRQDPSYVTMAYENLRPAYPDIQRPVSTRMPVSSLYSFAGAPAYR